MPNVCMTIFFNQNILSQDFSSLNVGITLFAAILMYGPVFVTQISPYAGDVGATPVDGIFNDAIEVVDAGNNNSAVDVIVVPAELNVS